MSAAPRQDFFKEPLLGRAIRAYFTTAAREGYTADQPSHTSSGPEWLDDKQYVTLRNGNGVLAVYRVRHNGVLRRMKRWPRGIDE